MKVVVLKEPMLEFGGKSRHVNPRHGIADYGPADVQNPAVRVIRVGIVGTSSAIDGLRRCIDRYREPIEAKPGKLGHLHVPFPGFDPDVGFRAELAWDARLERPIRERDLKALAGLHPQAAVKAAVDLYAAELDVLNEEAGCDVVLIARPDDLAERVEPKSDAVGTESSKGQPARADDFRALLKAVAMRYNWPIQIIRRSTWDANFKPPPGERLSLQDEATRAWNLFTAIYYKAGGVPWRLARESSDLDSCYVGVTFYRSTDQSSLETSVAQVFNQRGDGVIVRGAQAAISQHDKQPHLMQYDAERLLREALKRYRAEHKRPPARVVLHKTSSFTADEVEGFRAAADEAQLEVLELLWLPAKESVKLFRSAYYPPLRGTLFSLDQDHHVLYTGGSVPFYRTYPGMYVPSPISFRMVDTESSPEQLAEELLALTKMNWNQTQLDGRMPITLRTADRVGQILRHLGPKDRPQGRYAYYM
ncbi:argonaute/piwi family protein [Lentzea sp. NPDC054927]